MIEQVTNLEKDAEEIAFIEKNCFSVPWSLSQIKSSNETTTFFVAKSENKIVGYGGIYTVLDEGYITNIAVLPEFRKKGFGTKIVNKIIDFSKEKALKFVTLEVRVSNTDAINLYKSFGFEILGTRKEFYHEPVEDAYIMTRYFENEV